MRRTIDRRLLTLLAALSLTFLGFVPAFAIQTVCDVGCWTIPEPPPPSNCSGSCIPAGNPSVTISGLVDDVHGSPISNASVFWTYGSATTNSLGQFSIQVWTNHSVDLTAEVSRYAFKTLSNQAPSLTWAPTFQLQFAVSAPNQVAQNNQTTKTVHFAMYSTAPSTGTTVYTQLPDGSVTPLYFNTSYSSPSGWSKWDAYWNVPFTTSDGTYNVKICAVNAAGGTCDAPNGLVLASTTASFIVDSAPPVVSAKTPMNVNTTQSSPQIQATLSDSLSGVDPSHIVFLVDSVSQTPNFNTGSGLLTYTPTAAMSLGDHYVDVTVSDLAGNQTRVVWSFRLVTLTSSPTTASVAQTTVSVPAGSATASFSNVGLSISPLQFTISSFLGNGFDTWTRSVSLAGLTVHFSNGTTAQDVLASSNGSNPTAQSISTNVGAVGTFTGSATVSVPNQTINIGSISVGVPAGFACSSCTATLSLASSNLDAFVPAVNLMTTSIPVGVPINVTLSSTTSVEVDNNNGTLSVTPSTGQVSVSSAATGYVTRNLLVNNVGNSNDAFAGLPTINCDTAHDPPPQDATHLTCISTGLPLAHSQGYFSLGGGIVTTYGNRWLYRDAVQPTYVDWHQQAAVVGDQTNCVNGTTVTSKLTAFSTQSSQTILDATGHSAWDIAKDGSPLSWNTYTQTPSAHTPPRDSAATSLVWSATPTHSATNSAQFTDTFQQPGPQVSFTGQQPNLSNPGPIAAGDTWQSTGGGIGNTNEQMIIGVRYTVPPPASEI